MGKIPDSDLPTIIERYRNRELLTDIAKEYGCSDKALYQRIRLYCDSGKGDSSYHDLVTDLYVLRSLDMEEKLEEAADALELTRARELVKCAQWHLERRRAKLYGQKQQVEMDNRITVIVNRQPAVTPYIDVESVHNLPTNVSPQEHEDK